MRLAKEYFTLPRRARVDSVQFGQRGIQAGEMIFESFLVRVDVAAGFIGDAQGLDGCHDDADFFDEILRRMFSISSMSKTRTLPSNSASRAWR